MANELICKKKVGYFGVELYNFDVDNADHLAQLSELLDEYLVIMIKGLSSPISREQQIQMAKIFGEPTLAHPVVPGGDNLFPEIYEIDGANGGKNAIWHTDVTFLEAPHSVSILVADEVPKVGGDTLWADLRTAYTKMNEHIKSLLANLEAVHKMSPLAYWGVPFDYLSHTDNANIIKLYEKSTKTTAVIHPVVRIHPRTREPALFVNPGFTSHIHNLSNIESNNLLKLIYEHITQPEFVLRYKWEKNDIVIWDNICTAHYAINDYDLAPRKMRRVTVKGDLPFGYNNIRSKTTTDLLKIIR